MLFLGCDKGGTLYLNRNLVYIFTQIQKKYKILKDGYSLIDYLYSNNIVIVYIDTLYIICQKLLLKP